MTLLAWSEELPDWQRDALHRIAVSEQLSEEDRNAIKDRLMHSAGITIEADVAITPLSQADLPAREEVADPTVLCGIGPVRHVDKLANDQELRYGVSGITLNFGDNGAGKSGYARIAKKLCLARVVDDLQGDVFAVQRPPRAEIRFRYRLPGEEQPVRADWSDGDPRPQPLSHMMVLDTANTRTYVDGRNEITYLPREIEIVARFGRLCTALATWVDEEAASIAHRCRGLYGEAYSQTSTAGRVVRVLTTEAPLRNIPTEAAVRDAASWDNAKRDELAGLDIALAQNPAARAVSIRRIERALNALADEFAAATVALSDEAIANMVQQCVRAVQASEAAALSAHGRFHAEPIAGTGQAAWASMYRFARKFAAEGGVRPANEALEAGDVCPYCQSEIDEQTAARLRRFDDFVQSAAASEAQIAEGVLATTIEQIAALRVSNFEDVEQATGEYRDIGEPEATACREILAYSAALRDRKATVLQGLQNRALRLQDALPASPVEEIRGAATAFAVEAQNLEAQPGHSVEMIARAAELRDAYRLSQELESVLNRRADIERRQRLLGCKSGLDTRPISTEATRLRRELVTPELRTGIEDEIKELDLAGVPFRFDEASDRGRNYFDIVLDTPHGADKARVLSEGEQRALGIACFFAEMKRIRGKHGIIVDDPVSSLDHQRIRTVAKRLVAEAATGRQVIIFTHHLVFYQEVISAAAAAIPQVPVLANLISKHDGQFGIVFENDEPWIAKKVVRRIEALRARVNAIRDNADRGTDEYRRLAKDFYTDLRETWERFVEEVLLCSVVERFSSGVKTQSLRDLAVDDADYQVIFAAMKKVSECSGHDMAAGRQLPVPDKAEMRRDLDHLDQFRTQVTRRKGETRERRAALEGPPVGAVQ